LLAPVPGIATVAIEFARVRYISRSTDGNACRQAAYVAREAVKDERTGTIYNFAHREAPAWCEVLLPPGSSPGIATVAGLATAMELSENRKNSQTAREFVLALPADREVSHGDRCRDAARFRAGAFHLKGPRGDCFNPSGALRRPAEAAGL
jgi:hypothetical protein